MACIQLAVKTGGWRDDLTKRLYREFPEDTTFWGRIASVTREEDDRIAVELEQTLFFPASGGQLCDLGTLNEVPVLGVVEDGDTVIHTLGPDARTKKWAKGRELEGAIDSARRLDNMELHSAQHLLSAMLLRTLELRTVAFALGETSTLDVAAKELTPEQLASLESDVNAAIRFCHPVTVSEHRGSALIPTSIRTPLTPEEMEAPHGVRIVAIGPEDAPIDRDPCNGTHVTSTGQIGTLLILGAEPGPEETTRLTFVVGRRAYQVLRERLGPIGKPPS